MSCIDEIYDNPANYTMVPKSYFSSAIHRFTQTLSYQDAVSERQRIKPLGICANEMCKNGFRRSSARLDFVKLENKIFYKKFSTYIRNRIDCPSCEHALLWSTNYTLAPTDHDLKRMIRMNIKWGA